MNTVGVNYIYQYFDAMLMQTSFKYAALKNRKEQIYVAWLFLALEMWHKIITFDIVLR